MLMTLSLEIFNFIGYADNTTCDITPRDCLYLCMRLLVLLHITIKDEESREINTTVINMSMACLQ